MEDKIKFNTIRQLRRDLLLTPTKFAAALGVSEASIFSWEAGRRAPRLDKVKAMIELAKKNGIKLKPNDFFED